MWTIVVNLSVVSQWTIMQLRPDESSHWSLNGSEISEICSICIMSIWGVSDLSRVPRASRQIGYTPK